jgi:cysteinyl-tRNA synthetase
MREIKLTNSMSGKKEVFKPKVAGKVSMYSCGPTAYDLIHVGNLRAALTADLIFRTFQKFGFDVNYVRNYTDVDDKIIKRANEEKVEASEISKRFILEVEKDYALAGLLEPTHKTTVSGHMAEIIAMIEKIIKNGNGYVTEDGEVLFSVSSFKPYGQLSGKKLEDLIAGARVEVNEKKRSPADFSLWKPAKPGEPYWESPWGRGRPGWHIECSAMASRWLGDEMDIHHGGSDLIFPHHENEIAQSECASQHAPYVRYWLHNAMLNINSEKMSKSLGNFITARGFLAQYGQEITRMMVLASHYRSIADFSEDVVATASSSLQRLYEAKEKAQKLLNVKARLTDQRAEALWADFLAECQKCREDIESNMANDLNTPGVLGAVFTLIRAFNRTISEPRTEGSPSAVLGAQELIRIFEDELGGFLGVGRQRPEAVLTKLSELKLSHQAAAGGGGLSEDQIRSLLDARTAAKQSKNFAEADRIRAELDSKGVVIKDSPQGTTWNYK